MLTVTDVAKMLTTSDRAIYRLVNADQIPYLRVGYQGKTIRFIEEDIKGWMEQKKGGYDSLKEENL